MKRRRHVVITGTGRAGTTFLVELLTNLGLDTGFDELSMKQKKDPIAHAGLEYDIRQPECPYIVKAPQFFQYANQVLNKSEINIEHVFVPVRDIEAAAESRIKVTIKRLSMQSLQRRIRYSLGFIEKEFPGGIVGTNSLNKSKQKDFLLTQFYELMYQLADSQIRLTLIEFPRLVNDSQYLYLKLKPILEKISYVDFNKVFLSTVQNELISNT